MKKLDHFPYVRLACTETCPWGSIHRTCKPWQSWICQQNDGRSQFHNLWLPYLKSTDKTDLRDDLQWWKAYNIDLFVIKTSFSMPNFTSFVRVIRAYMDLCGGVWWHHCVRLYMSTNNLMVKLFLDQFFVQNSNMSSRRPGNDFYTLFDLAVCTCTLHVQKL